MKVKINLVAVAILLMVFPVSCEQEPKCVTVSQSDRDQCPLREVGTDIDGGINVSIVLDETYIENVSFVDERVSDVVKFVERKCRDQCEVMEVRSVTFLTTMLDEDRISIAAPVMSARSIFDIISIQIGEGYEINEKQREVSFGSVEIVE